MGYTLALRVGSVDQVAAELRRPTLDPAAVRAALARPASRGAVEDPDVDEVLARWPELAAAAAAGVEAGGGDVDGLLATYVHLVVGHLTHWYGALAHTSSGGEDFRARLLPGPVAAAMGADVVQHLVTRDVAGLRASIYPMVGWVSNAELRAVVARGPAAAPVSAGPGSEDDEDAVRTVVAAVERAAAGGLDLFGLYG